MRAPIFALAATFILALGASRPAAAAETCGNGVDDDTNGMADEGCNPAAVTGVCESPLGCGSNGEVAPKKGAITYTLPPDFDVKTPRGFGLRFQRSYASMYEPGGSAPAYRTPLGPHWFHTYMSWLDKGTGNAVVHRSRSTVSRRVPCFTSRCSTATTKRIGDGPVTGISGA